jgi:hypothetical protein
VPPTFVRSLHMRLTHASTIRIFPFHHFLPNAMQKLLRESICNNTGLLIMECLPYEMDDDQQSVRLATCLYLSGSYHL